jgi:two-component sensor histidine kinase
MGDQIVLDGPEIELAPATAQTLALVIHELATNAAKYGSLSVETGRVSISWFVQDEGIEIVWQEDQGPPVAEPTARGFGTRSVIASVESQLGGRAAFDWRQAGLVCILAVPLRQIVENNDAIFGLEKIVTPAKKSGCLNPVQ